MSKDNRNNIVNCFSVTIISFLLIFFGLKYAAGSQFSVQNSLFLLGFCLLLGFISSIFYQFKMKVAWIVFNAGLGIGLINMFYTFFRNLSGWEDLAALASLFVWIVIGLGAGLIIQLILFLYLKYKKNK